MVTKGSYTVIVDGEETTAREGEVIYLWSGSTGVYDAHEDAEVIAVTVPPYQRALRESTVRPRGGPVNGAGVRGVSALLADRHMTNTLTAVNGA